MFIDTETANSRFSRPQVIVSDRRTSPYNERSTPLLEPFVGQDAPPTYLEATTPGLYSARLSAEEGARLLSSGERESQDAQQKENQYGKNSVKETFLKGKALRAIGFVFTIMALTTILAVVLAAGSTRKDKQVSRLC